MKNEIEKSIADSLETDAILLPYMSFLLQDMWALGCSEKDIISSVGSLDLTPESCIILDLGCGKGALSVQIASGYKCKAVGIDVMPSFLKVAVQKAKEYHITHLCQFIQQDIKDYVTVTHDYDVVILASLGGIFGSIKNTVSRLRTQVRSSGYMIIDDGYLKHKDSLKRKGYDHYKNYHETIRELTSYGDQVIREINTSEFSKELNVTYLKLIKKRGKELIARHPELKKDISSYITLQTEECEVLDTQIEGALWVLKKQE
jgi:cyclopropane fatty-acyl-phospholipid synthase-like methyltransferase